MGTHKLKEEDYTYIFFWKTIPFKLLWKHNKFFKIWQAVRHKNYLGIEPIFQSLIYQIYMKITQNVKPVVFYLAITVFINTTL